MKRYKGITTIKIFEFRNIRSDTKKCCNCREKRKQYVRQINKLEHLPQTITPCYWLTHEPLIQCDAPVAENSFIDDCK